MATKPFFTRSRSLVDRRWREPRAQWWLVTTSPSALTKEPVQPPRVRVERRTWSIQSFPGSKAYFSFSCFRGRLAKVHMPAAARRTGRASTDTRDKANAERRFMGTPEDNYYPD